MLTVADLTKDERLIVSADLSKLNNIDAPPQKQKRPGRPWADVPTCRRLLEAKQRCRACKRKRGVCLLRKLKQLVQSPVPEPPVDLGKREKKPRDFYADFASADDVSLLDDRLDNDITMLYPWCPSVSQGGQRKSPRFRLRQTQKQQLEKGKETMKSNPLHRLIRTRKQLISATPATANIGSFPTATCNTCHDSYAPSYWPSYSPSYVTSSNDRLVAKSTIKT